MSADRQEMDPELFGRQLVNGQLGYNLAPFIQALTRYQHEHIETGGFLRAVLEAAIALLALAIDRGSAHIAPRHGHSQ